MFNGEIRAQVCQPSLFFTSLWYWLIVIARFTSCQVYQYLTAMNYFQHGLSKTSAYSMPALEMLLSNCYSFLRPSQVGSLNSHYLLMLTSMILMTEDEHQSVLCFPSSKNKHVLHTFPTLSLLIHFASIGFTQSDRWARHKHSNVRILWGFGTSDGLRA